MSIRVRFYMDEPDVVATRRGGQPQRVFVYDRKVDFLPRKGDRIWLPVGGLSHVVMVVHHFEDDIHVVHIGLSWHASMADAAGYPQ